MTRAVEFRATIRVIGVNPYVLVTKRIAECVRREWRKPMPVLVRINGQPRERWRINMMPRGDGSFYLYLHGLVRKASGTKPGDRVTVRLSFDTTYRSGPAHPMHSWFRVPLSKNAKASAAWNALTPSRRKEILRYLSGLKSNEARQRNLKRALSALSGRPGRYMARSWTNGR
jgi:hypothetical protein